MPIRVVQWTTGNVGKQSVRAIVSNPDFELVGCYARILRSPGLRSPRWLLPLGFVGGPEAVVRSPEQALQFAAERSGAT